MTDLVEIKSRNVIYSSTQETVPLAVVEAVAGKISLHNADLAGVDFTGLDLTGGDFQRSDFTGAILSGANLTDCNFEGTDLTGAVMNDNACTATRAIFRNAKMDGANVDGVDFSDAFMQGVQAASLIGTPVGGLLRSVEPSKVYCNTDVPAGNTVADATSGTFVSKYTIPANSLNVGDVVRITARGGWSATGVAPSVVVALGIGSVSVGGFDSGAMTTLPDDNGWSMSMDCVVLSTGEAANMECQGTCMFGLSDGTHIAQNIYVADPTASEFDLTGPADVTFAANWSAANAGNSVTLRQLIVEILRS